MPFWPEFFSGNVTLPFCFLVVPQEKNAAGKAPSLSLQRQASKKAEVGDFMPVRW